MAVVVVLEGATVYVAADGAEGTVIVIVWCGDGSFGDGAVADGAEQNVADDAAYVIVALDAGVGDVDVVDIGAGAYLSEEALVLVGVVGAGLAESDTANGMAVAIEVTLEVVVGALVAASYGLIVLSVVVALISIIAEGDIGSELEVLAAVVVGGLAMRAVYAIGQQQQLGGVVYHVGVGLGTFVHGGPVYGCGLLVAVVVGVWYGGLQCLAVQLRHISDGAAEWFCAVMQIQAAGYCHRCISISGECCTSDGDTTIKSDRFQAGTLIEGKIADACHAGRDDDGGDVWITSESYTRYRRRSLFDSDVTIVALKHVGYRHIIDISHTVGLTFEPRCFMERIQSNTFHTAMAVDCCQIRAIGECPFSYSSYAGWDGDFRELGAFVECVASNCRHAVGDGVCSGVLCCGIGHEFRSVLAEQYTSFGLEMIVRRIHSEGRESGAFCEDTTIVNGRQPRADVERLHVRTLIEGTHIDVRYSIGNRE